MSLKDQLDVQMDTSIYKMKEKLGIWALVEAPDSMTLTEFRKLSNIVLYELNVSLQHLRIIMESGNKDA